MTYTLFFLSLLLGFGRIVAFSFNLPFQAMLVNLSYVLLAVTLIIGTVFFLAIIDMYWKCTRSIKVKAPMAKRKIFK